MRISDWSSDVCSSDLSKETAGDKPEEGGDDVKSSWPLRPGLHTYNNGKDRGLRTREGKPIPDTFSQSGSESANRLREVGLASNRRSALLRRIRSRALYTPPVQQWAVVSPKPDTFNLGRT